MTGTSSLWLALPAILALAAKVALLSYTIRSGRPERYAIFFIWFLIALGIQNLGEIGHFVALKFGDPMLLGTSLNIYYVATVLSLPAIVAFALQLALGNSGRLNIDLIWISLLILCGILALLVPTSDLIISGYQVIVFSAKRIPGEYFFLLELALVASALATIALFVYGAVTGSSFRSRMLNSYMLVGIAPLAISVVAVVVALHLFDTAYNAAMIVPIAVTWFLLVTAYAIRNHKLLDIQFALPWTALAQARRSFHQRLTAFSRNFPATMPRAIKEMSEMLSCPVALVGLQEPIMAGGHFNLEGIKTSRLKRISEWTHVSTLRRNDKALSKLLMNKGVEAVAPFHLSGDSRQQGWLLFGTDNDSEMVTRSDVANVQEMIARLESAYDQRMTRLTRQLEKYQAREQGLLEQIEQLKKKEQESAQSAAGESHPAEAVRMDDCLVIGSEGDFEALRDQGASLFQKPESAFKAVRSARIDPRVCIVDLSAVPGSTVRSIDLRLKCPKVWIGRKAPDPAVVKSPGLYQARGATLQLLKNMDCIAVMYEGISVPPPGKTTPLLPLITHDTEYREDLGAIGEYDRAVLTSQDETALVAAAYYAALSSGRRRVWTAATKAGLKSARARAQKAKNLSDVTVIVYPKVTCDLTVDSLPDFPDPCHVLYLAAEPAPALDVPGYSLPRLEDRPRDTRSWITFFVARSSIEQGIAVERLDETVNRVFTSLHGTALIEEIRLTCERAVKRQALAHEEEAFAPYEDRVRNYERQILQQALQQNEGNLTHTARSLGLAESSLRYKMNALGLSASRPRSGST